MASDVFIAKLRNVKLLAYDFDGVLTDNTVYIDQAGTESVRVHRGDGQAISLLKKRGYHQVIISTEKNPVVSMRAKKLNIDCFQDCSNKKAALETYCLDKNIALSQALFIGNDLNDIDVMRISGVACCPMDAAKEVVELSDYTFQSKGGCGVVRELYDLFVFDPFVNSHGENSLYI